jgi:hypothetical protein
MVMMMVVVLVDEDGDFHSYETPLTCNYPVVFVSNPVTRVMEMITGN